MGWLKIFKGELHPGKNKCSLNEEKSDEQTVKIWVKSENPFKSYEFSKLLFPSMLSILELGRV